MCVGSTGLSHTSSICFASGRLVGGGLESLKEIGTDCSGIIRKNNGMRHD
jgi:hypothetical protein